MSSAGLDLDLKAELDLAGRLAAKAPVFARDFDKDDLEVGGREVVWGHRRDQRGIEIALGLERAAGEQRDLEDGIIGAAARRRQERGGRVFEDADVAVVLGDLDRGDQRGLDRSGDFGMAAVTATILSSASAS